MGYIVTIIEVVALLAAGALVGNWFLKEVKQSKARREPWYEPYLSPPGIIILVALSLPILAWLFRNFS